VPSIDELEIADEPEAWTRAGFDVEELERQGFELRRRREGPTPGGSTRQAFFRAGEPILEVVQAPEGSSVARDPDGPARLWGLACLVDDMEHTARALGDLLGRPRDAVQPGRRIATLRSEAGSGRQSRS
jgi:hypothetical protein